MDILDILLDILLKPPQPFIGLFYFFKPHFKFPKLNWNITEVTEVPEVPQICPKFNRNTARF